MRYRDHRRERQHQAIEAMAVPFDDEDSAEAALERARQARIATRGGKTRRMSS